MTYKFVIRNNSRFVRYVQSSWRYFLHSEYAKAGVKIIIRKDNVFIHISQAFSVILNDLDFIRKNPEMYPHFEASKKALAWLNMYRA